MINLDTLLVNKKKTALFDVYIGRPGFWGNPIKLEIDDREGRLDCLLKYWAWLTKTESGAQHMLKVHELKGKILQCWCVPNLCHGHILVRLANDPEGFEYCQKRIELMRAELVTIRMKKEEG